MCIHVRTHACVHVGEGTCARVYVCVLCLVKLYLPIEDEGVVSVLKIVEEGYGIQRGQLKMNTRVCVCMRECAHTHTHTNTHT